MVRAASFSVVVGGWEGEVLMFVLVLVACVVDGEGVGCGLLEVGLRLRRVEGGRVGAMLEGVDVDVVVDAVVAVDSSITGNAGGSPVIGFENNSFHSSSTSSSSPSLSSSARDSSSSRTLCIRFSNCLSRTISACASWRRSSGFICGRERSNWDSSVRA